MRRKYLKSNILFSPFILNFFTVVYKVQMWGCIHIIYVGMYTSSMTTRNYIFCSLIHFNVNTEIYWKEFEHLFFEGVKSLCIERILAFAWEGILFRRVNPWIGNTA